MASQAPGGAGVRVGNEPDLDNEAGVLVAISFSSKTSFGVASGGVELGRWRGSRRGGNGVAAHAPGGLGVFRAVKLLWKAVVGDAGP